ncbi:FAD binding domain protein [Colletotrichum truncatum]|uniref:FAD binding domain protein n=1 Tax=Colletotrichum truncatum TaxID=5467 RepID=A0ACC3Z252_COLTU|nr:FAD binding domain protein [Colletotrichum truncatum]KAF6781680.1 FAD binding domain protein [Colletotrichum truncatum]
MPASTHENGIHLVIVGAGLAGLSAALSTKLANPSHRVTICEAVDELKEIGAGLQVTPNGARLLERWGILDGLTTTVPRTMSVRRYDGTKLLAHEPNLQQLMRDRCSSPILHIHRADLQRAMIAKCTCLGVVTKLGRRVDAVDFNEALVTMNDGSTVHGDVVLLADGLWSTIRDEFAGREHAPLATGDMAYRLSIHADEIDGPYRNELQEFISQPALNIWLGPSSHVVGYSLRGGKILNLVFLMPDTLPEGVSQTNGSLLEISSALSWDPLLVKLLQASKQVTKWKLMWTEPLPQWASTSGTFFMAGDCCHPMLPYLAQGANSSLEDGALLGHLLGNVSDGNKTSMLPKVAKVYQRLRMERGSWIQAETFKQRDVFHLSDGAEQEKRDEMMVGLLGEKIEAPFPIRFFCPVSQRKLFDYDAYEEAERAWRTETGV